MSGKKSLKAYENMDFIGSPDGRLLRIMAEMLEPKQRFRREKCNDTIVFFGSARTRSKADAELILEKAERLGDEKKIESAKADVYMSRYYEEARELANRLTKWSMKQGYHYYVSSGGGPGIMEAANRGASEVPGGKSVGLNISLPFEQNPNPYITDELNFEFNYFFVRKFWFNYLAKAILAFPGGFGTFDEFFEIMTLIQTKKTTKQIPVILYGEEFWRETVNFDGLVKHKVISAEDLDLFTFVDDVDTAFDLITSELEYQRKMFPDFYRD